jgi:4-hydroxy-tetrahydrodipicolinate synthase
MLLYNVPGRTGADVLNDTVLRLAQLPGIIGIKDATRAFERGTDLIRRAPRGFAIYSGEDSTALALMLLGGHGVISVTANVAPRLMHEMCARALSGDDQDFARAESEAAAAAPAPVRGGNPIPVKWALAEMGSSRAAFACR